MKSYWTVVSLLLLIFIVVFFMVELINPAVLTDPHELMGIGGITAALAGIGLLVADIVLPVPSSLIMLANGALFGVFTGALLSTAGSLSAALVGFWIGRRGEPVLARFVSGEERSRANHLLNEWGTFAVILTRPVPILAEATAIMAGASSMQLRSMTLSALAGSVPIAVVYAAAGATAANWNSAIVAFGIVLLMTGLFWLAGRREQGKRSTGGSMPNGASPQPDES